MGQRIVLTCERCGCRETMSVGGGLMTNNPDVIASCLNPKEAEEWNRLYRNNKVKSFQAEQKVFYCEKCKKLSCLLSVAAELTNGKEITLGDQCGKCQTKMQEIKWQEKPVCPICNTGNLEWKQVGLWD